MLMLVPHPANDKLNKGDNTRENQRLSEKQDYKSSKNKGGGLPNPRFWRLFR